MDFQFWRIFYVFSISISVNDLDTEECCFSKSNLFIGQLLYSLGLLIFLEFMERA